MYLYFLCFLVCFEMGITEWASLVRVCERGGNSQVYRNPTGLTVALWRLLATVARMRRRALVTRTTEKELTPQVKNLLLFRNTFQTHANTSNIGCNALSLLFCWFMFLSLEYSIWLVKFLECCQKLNEGEYVWSPPLWLSVVKLYG